MTFWESASRNAGVPSGQSDSCQVFPPEVENCIISKMIILATALQHGTLPYGHSIRNLDLVVRKLQGTEVKQCGHLTLAGGLLVIQQLELNRKAENMTINPSANYPEQVPGHSGFVV